MKKNRITVMLSAKSDGTKLKPFVLLERKRPLKELEHFKTKLELVYCGKSWMDDDLTTEYLKRVSIFKRNVFNFKVYFCDTFFQISALCRLLG